MGKLLNGLSFGYPCKIISIFDISVFELKNKTVSGLNKIALYFDSNHHIENLG